MSFSPTPPAATERSRILSALLSDEWALGIGDPVLLWFAPASSHTSGSPCIIDPHQPHVFGAFQVREIYIDPTALPGLWWQGSQTGQVETAAKAAIDQAVLSAFSKCVHSRTQVSPARDGKAEQLERGIERPPGYKGSGRK